MQPPQMRVPIFHGEASSAHSRRNVIAEESFNACLADQKIVDGITWVRDRAVNCFKLNATPTFFINGNMYVGEKTFDEMEQLIRAAR